MLQILIVEINQINKGRIGQNVGEKLHGAFIRLLEQYDEKLAAEADAKNKQKKYTLSLLQRNKRPGRFCFRMTFLDHDFGLDVKRILESAITKRDIVALDHRNFRFESLIAATDGLEVPFADNLDEILADASTDSLIELRFLSPTTFDHGFSYPLPCPELVFKSFLNRWFAIDVNMSREEFDNINSTIKKQLAIIDYKIRPQKIKFERCPDMIGFTGQATYQIYKYQRIDPFIVKQINALADFAYYCGTGTKTTMGMGQTIRLR